MAFNYSPKTITDGLVLALDAANHKSYPGSGTNVTDLSGNGNDGTLVNGPIFDSDNGGIFNFDGANDEMTITMASTISFTNTDNFTMGLWVNKTGTPLSGDVNGLFLTQGGGRFGIDYYFGASQIRAGIRNTANGQYTTTFNTNLEGWNYCVFTYETENTSGMKLYTQGVLRSSRTTVGLGDFTSTGDFRIGTTYALGGTIKRLIGEISNARIYNRALTSAEVLQNYNATKGRFGL